MEKIVISVIVIYLYGSIPFSYLVGKIIYKKDITKEGSKNIGGTNLGRICGKRAFVLGFTLDASKGVLAVLIANHIGISPILLAPFALLGHAYSVFMKFSGGKGISTACGFVLAYSFFGAVFALVIFIFVLYFKGYVSLASIVSIFFYVLYAMLFQPKYYTILVLIIYLCIIYLHRENIKRLRQGTEPKVKWSRAYKKN